jgi:hypothetical protein
MERRLKQAGQTAPLRILEAGCGTTWPLRLDDVQHTTP